jgi:pimeloyl-ACP methyl ester carboxylesterase
MRTCTIFFSAACIFLSACDEATSPENLVTGDSDCRTDPYPAELVDNTGLFHKSAELEDREPRIQFRTRTGSVLDAFVYRATGFTPETGSVVFIMHGANRNADDYLRRFRPMAERYGALAIAPEFPKSLYGPDSEPYTLGLGKGKTPSGGTFQPQKWRNSHDYVYSEIEHLFESLRRQLDLETCSYRIWGHSAGAQFVHRLITFLPDARVESAVAANAGFYTMPTMGSGEDARYFMPYGLQGSPVSHEQLARLFAAPLSVLIGELDLDDSGSKRSVRNTWQANAQGPNRRLRAGAYYAAAKEEARKMGVKFAWRFAEVPGAGHKSREMGPSVAWYLFSEQSEQPCRSTAGHDARAIVINEIHTDPAPDLEGDANREGARDSLEDEFVELINLGERPVCLSGWYLGDTADSSRHRFPLGTQVAANGVLLVFGGGVPQGDFGGAIVQTAAFDGKLALSNDGDVLTLADSLGSVVQQISWGDCGEKACAREHIDGPLDNNESVNRWPEFTGDWVSHGKLSGGRPYSPGFRVDATPLSTLRTK